MRFHFRRARRYECLTPYVPATRRKRVPVPVEIVHARVSNSGLVEFKVAWAGRESDNKTTWEAESYMATKHKALIDVFEKLHVERGRPTDMFAEGTSNAAARRLAHAEWSAARWAIRLHHTDEADRAAILARQVLLDQDHVILRVCYVKVETIADA